MQQAEHWGTRIGLVLAMAGNAVGLGNFLRFPVQAIQNGGGAFIIPYFVCFVFIGVPLLWVEWSMGKFASQHHKHSLPAILQLFSSHRIVKYFGVFSLFTNIIVAAYYTYIESWTLGYLYFSITQKFRGQGLEEVQNYFEAYQIWYHYEGLIFWLITCLLNIYILSKGIQKGIEAAAKLLMPMLILFAIILAIFALSFEKGDYGAVLPGIYGFDYLWTSDFSSILKPKVWLAAAGQIFFTLALGMGTIQCYASYMKKEEDVALNAMASGWLNEFVEIVLGASIIIPICVGFLGLEKVQEWAQQGGMGLSFKVLPYLFVQWGPWLGTIMGSLWFGALFFAGITSSLAMGLPFLSFMSDYRGWKHSQSAWLFGLLIMALGIPCILSPIILDEFDFWAGSFSLVLFAVIEMVLFSWVWGIDKGWKAINENAKIKIPLFFKWIIHKITPLFLIIIFIANLPNLFEKLYQETDSEILVARILMIAVFTVCLITIYRSKI
jgi:SNF family Na+-dependent transporter